MNSCETCIFAEKKNKEFAYCRNFEKCVNNSDSCKKHRINTLIIKK